jgi:Flp pilus assembly CpaF family ATPase
MHPDAPREIEPLIGEAVDFIVHIARTDKGRVVREILRVIDFDRRNQLYNIESAALKHSTSAEGVL